MEFDLFSFSYLLLDNKLLFWVLLQVYWKVFGFDKFRLVSTVIGLELKALLFFDFSDYESVCLILDIESALRRVLGLILTFSYKWDDNCFEGKDILSKLVFFKS